MEKKQTFLDKIRAGQLCLGTCVTWTDPTVTEALSGVMDFLWIDSEHNPFSLETIQRHVIAGKGGLATIVVRVPFNDPVLIKPVLDLGASGVVIPLVRSRADVELAVAATHYPPEGIRGFGPRRPTNYGRIGGPDYIAAANKSIITIVQIEHIDAVNQIDDILTVPGLSTIMVGPNDLAGSMGHSGNPRDPEVMNAVKKVIAAAQRHNMPIGLAMGDNIDFLSEWARDGIQWLSIGADFIHMLRGVELVASAVRERATAFAHQKRQ